MEALLAVVFGLIGAAFGSFLNVCIDRLPSGRSLAYPPSHCEACQHPLSPWDLVPVFSYLWLRGRCRYCRSAIPQRLFWIELAVGLIFAFIYWWYGLSVNFAVVAFYACLFIVLLGIDLEHHLILNRVVYPAWVVVLILDIFLPQPGIVYGLIGSVVGFVILLIPALVYPEGMGWGDVKMAALIGLVTGFPLVFVALFLSIVMGGLVGGVLLLFKLRKRKEGIPFAPYLSVATVVTLVWGSQILGWYLRFF